MIRHRTRHSVSRLFHRSIPEPPIHSMGRGTHCCVNLASTLAREVSVRFQHASERSARDSEAHPTPRMRR